jgi:hypothetical protein
MVAAQKSQAAQGREGWGALPMRWAGALPLCADTRLSLPALHGSAPDLWKATVADVLMEGLS